MLLLLLLNCCCVVVDTFVIVPYAGCPCLFLSADVLLWSPYVIGQTIIFSSCGFFFFFLLFFLA